MPKGFEYVVPMKQEDAKVLLHIHMVEIMQLIPLGKQGPNAWNTGQEVIPNVEGIMQITMQKSHKSHYHQGNYHQR